MSSISASPCLGCRERRRTSGTQSTASVAATTTTPPPISATVTPRIAAIGPATAAPTGLSAYEPRASYAETRESMSPGICSCMAVLQLISNTSIPIPASSAALATRVTLTGIARASKGSARSGTARLAGPTPGSRRVRNRQAQRGSDLVGRRHRLHRRQERCDTRHPRAGRTMGGCQPRLTIAHSLSTCHIPLAAPLRTRSCAVGPRPTAALPTGSVSTLASHNQGSGRL